MTHQDIDAKHNLDPKTMEAALGRINFTVTTKRHGERINRWGILHWLINFANADYAGMDADALAKRQEEVQALEEQDQDTGVENHQPPPTRDQLTAFQATLRRHFTDLTQRGRLRLGPFSFEMSVLVPMNMPKPHGALQARVPRLSATEHFVHASFPPAPGELLLYHLSRCLRDYADLVKPCEWCRKLFLQQRRVRSPQRAAKYCSHYHRTLASKQRAAQTREAERRAVTERIRKNSAHVAKPSSRGKKQTRMTRQQTGKRGRTRKQPAPPPTTRSREEDGEERSEVTWQEKIIVIGGSVSERASSGGGSEYFRLDVSDNSNVTPKARPARYTSASKATNANNGFSLTNMTRQKASPSGRT